DREGPEADGLVHCATPRLGDAASDALDHRATQRSGGEKWSEIARTCVRIASISNWVSLRYSHASAVRSGANALTSGLNQVSAVTTLRTTVLLDTTTPGLGRLFRISLSSFRCFESGAPPSVKATARIFVRSSLLTALI